MDNGNDKEKWFYSYSIEFYDELDKETKIKDGWTLASDYHEAIDNLYTYYGEEYIASIRKIKPEIEGEPPVFDIEEWKEGF